MSDLITFTSSMLPGTTRVVGFRGSEGISRLYRFEVFVVAPSEGVDFDLADAIGTKAQIVVAKDAKAPPFFCSGVLGSLDLLHELEGQALLRAVIVPRLAELALSTHSRIFTQKSPIDVIKAVLEDNGVTDYEVRVGASAVEEHICQYRETDLDFISRWMEREGIRYYFEHGEDGEKLILADDSTYPAEPLGLPVRYYPQTGNRWSGAMASFRSFASRNRSVSARVKLRDNNYEKPSFDLSGAATVSGSGAGEVNLYGERFFDPGSAERLAKIRAESLAATQSVYHAMGPRLYLHAGYAFELDEHPRPSFNTRYLVVEAHHHGNQAADSEHLKPWLDLEHDDPYLVEVAAIAAKTPYRAPITTPWPRIYSFENAVVDGPATSEYAQIDAQGRYAVKFHFDESALKDGQASTWVRMMQPHGGTLEGFHFPLRKGTEVVCSFLGGDPDRPVISGVVPNMLTPSPVTSGNFTKNVIQTGGRNRLELEDLAGQQRVTLSTPLANSYLRMGSPNDDHHVILKTDGQQLLHAGANWDLIVGGEKTERITGNVNKFYDADMFDTVISTRNEKVGSHKTTVIGGNHTTNVTGDVFLSSIGNHQHEVQGNHSRQVQGNQNSTVTGNTTQKTQDKSDHVLGNNTKIVDGNDSSTIGGNATSEVKGNRTNKTNGAAFSSALQGSFSSALLCNFSNTLGVAISGVEGMAMNVVAGVRLNFTTGPQSTVSMGPTFSQLLGITSSFIVGGKTESIEGFKFEIVTGLVYKNKQVSVSTAMLKGEQTMTDVQQQELKAGARALEVSLADLQANM